MSTNLLERFAQPRSKVQIIIDRYQYIISIVATFLFFSDIPDYLHAASVLPIIPLLWIVAFTILAIPFIKKASSIPKPLLIWMGLYLFVSILSLMTVSADEISFTDFRAKVLSMLFIVLMYAIFNQKSVTHIKLTILVVIFMTIGNNFVELLNPRFFAEINVGRPAGFYIDPNKTGCALMLGMLMSITAIKKSFRWILVLAVGIGIMATFSRGAILGWIICTFLLVSGRMLSDRRRTIIIPGIILIVLLASLNPLKLLTDYFKGDPSGANWDIVNRLEEFQNPSLSEDSAMSRQAVATGAWVMFGDRPFWGNGLASTRKWMVADVSTHNMYLYYMADHGIIGVIFLPGAILAVVYRNRGEQSTILLCFAVFLALWGLFSHEVLAERYTLSTFALLAALNTNQSWYLKYTNRNYQTAPTSLRTPLLLPPARNVKMLPPSRD
jgi:O-Antigen ligase